MEWFADLAGKAENLLTNLDEQTGVALRNHNPIKPRKQEKQAISNPEPRWKKSLSPKGISTANETRASVVLPRKKAVNVPINATRGSTKEPPQPKEKLVRKKSPAKRAPVYTLNHCPKTMVGDIRDIDVAGNNYGMRQRRYHVSLPDDLNSINTDRLTYKMQNLEVENAMLKNELNVLNHEVSELLTKLHRSEDGNILVNGYPDLKHTTNELENSELVKNQLIVERDSLSSQMAQLRQRVQELTGVEGARYKEHNLRLETEVRLLTDRNNELEDKIKQLTEKFHERDLAHIKVENDYRHAQTTISDLQNELDRSKAECVRLEKDWETYKLRVKSMLFAKDNEIKLLQEGMNLTEDTKILIEQLENLKDEREVLSESVLRIQSECENLRTHIEQLESRHNSAERVVAALREALRDERAARNRSESQCIAMGKELKSIQIETGQIIANLRTALHDKEKEINQLRETSSDQTTDTSALNVGDYDVMQESIDNDKIHYLTDTLVQKQGRIDSLMADNNMLRIQLDKLQSKYQAEVSALKAQTMHSVVHLQDTEYRRPRSTMSALSTLSLRVGVALKRYPVFRLLMIVYMIGLHFWVLTVLFTSTPENYLPKTSKS